MEKLYILRYEKSDNDISALVIADPDIKLPNGNIKVVNIIIGNYADELIKELTKARTGAETGKITPFTNIK